MKQLISACIAIALCYGTISAKTFLVDSHLSVVNDETLASHNNDGGTYALYKGKYYRIGVTGFRSLKEFASNATSATSGDTLYVAPGQYTEDATINVAGLTILGHNANKDWTSTRDALETELQATLSIEASNIIVNGFKVTGNGRILSNLGSNSTPFSGIKVLYNYFCNSTVVRNFNHPLIEIGNRYTNEYAPNDRSQLRYLNCEVAHNYFYFPEGTTESHPCGIAVCGAGGTTRVHDNYFYETGTSVLIENAQGNIHINHNIFKDVGANTIHTAKGTGDNDKKGDFSIVLYRSAFANSTTANIQDNEFDNCQGQETLGALIRVWGGNPSNADFVTPVNYKININRNSFKGKTSIVSSDIMKADNNSVDQAAENLIVYQDNRDQYDNVIYNLQDNRYDNRLYKFAWIKLNDGRPRREIYANNFTQFVLAHDYSTYGSGQWTTGDINSTVINTDVTNVAAYFDDDRNTSIKQYPNSVIQSMDIDPETGDIYVLQKLGTNHNTTLCNAYGLVASEEEGLILTRIPCIARAVRHTSNADKRLDKYDINGSNCESMQLLRAGHGVKLSIVRDKNGQLWMLTGSKGDNKGSANDISGNAVAKFKFVNGARAILTEEGHSADLKRSDMNLTYIEHPLGYTNVYGTVDENSRYFCFSSSGSGLRSYCIYDLDEILEGKTNPKLLKEISIPKHTKPLQSTEFLNGNYTPTTDAEFNAIDKGFETWPYQSYAISGDYLYFLEGISDSPDNNSSLIVKSGDPVIVISTYNWRTNQYLKRYRVNYARVNRNFGEPEGLTIRPDIYGHSSLYIALADGESSNRRTSIYRWHVNRYIQHFGESDGYKTLTYRISGDDKNTNSLHFDNTQYSGITFTHNAPAEGLTFSASQPTEEAEAQIVTITNTGEYRYGAWDGTISGDDAGLFSVEIQKNDQFSSETVTATIKFTPDGKKREYNATLRLFSPLASSNVESNDIVIPLIATYDGPLAYGMKPQITTEQVTQTIDDETYYSFNLALNAMLPEPYDNAYLAYTNGNTAEVLPFRELIDKYVVVMEDATSNFESTDLLTNKATHITIGNENALDGSDWATMLSSKNIDNSYTKEGYGTTPEGNFMDQITITNGFEVSQADASNGKAEGASHYSNYADLYSKPLVLHNVDPSKSYNFRLYLSKSSADKMDAWEALYLDYADDVSKTMFIPSTSLAFSDAIVVSDNEEYNGNTDATDMPMGSHNTITNEGALLSDPIHYRNVNQIASDGAFGTLNVTSEVVNYWDINYDINLGGDINASYDNNIMNHYKDSDGLLKGISTKLSYLPVKFATTEVVAEDGRIQHEPIDATQIYNATVKVDYTRTANNSLPETTVEGVAIDNEYQFKNSPIFTGVTLSHDNIVAKLWEHNASHLIYGSWDDKVDDYHNYYYDAFMQLNWDNDIDLNHGIGVYASGLGCTGHNNINVAPTEILSDSWIADYGQTATNTINGIGYVDYNGSYCDENNWSEIAAQKCSLPIKVHYVWGGNNKITSNESATIPVTLTTNYPILVKSIPTLNIERETVATTSLIETDAPSQWIDVVTIPTKTTISVVGKDIITGVGNILADNNNLLIFPNPASDYVNVNATVNLQNIEIYSIDGQLLISEIVDTNNVKIDVSNLPSGTYIIRSSTFANILMIK